MRPHAVPSSGYFSLWPFLDLGGDKAIALYSVGCRKYRRPLKATGFALRIPTAAKAHAQQADQAAPRRLRATTLPLARLEALDKAQGRPATVLRAVSRGRVTVWEQIEDLALLKADQAEALEAAQEIRPDGTLLAKAFNPRVNASLTGLVNRLATTVTHELSGLVKPLLGEAMEAWNDLIAPGVNFADMSQRQFDQAWTEGSRFLQTAVDKGYGLAAPGILHKFNVELSGLHKDNQKYLKNVHLPRTQISFNQVDEQVLTSIADQSGFWVRDSAGNISNSLSTQGRGIIQDGIKSGLGRDQIAKNLIGKLPGMWQKYGFNYARTVAANSVSRARSYSEVASYANAGISYLEIMAMLDERTTDQCRALDGTVIEVKVAMDHQVAAANVQSPQDIAKVSPFLDSRRNKKTGNKELFVHGTTKKFATVSRSGFGKVDDRGVIAKHMSTKVLNKSGITMPPYHHQCRTMTVPRHEMIQVPSGYDVQSDPTPSTNDEPPPKKPRPSAPKPKQQQRPLKAYKPPTPKKPVVTGQKIPIDTPPKRLPGAPPKKVQQVPAKKYPATLGAYNTQTKAQLEAAHNGKKVKITEVKLNSMTGQLEYTYLVDKKVTGKVMVKTNPAQRSDLERRLKRRDRRQTRKKPAPPKPATHGVEGMQRATSGWHGRDGQYAQDRRTKDWNTDATAATTESARGRFDQITEHLYDDDDFNAMLKHSKYDSPYAFVAAHSNRWEQTSRGGSTMMHYMQLATAEEFGLPASSTAMLRPGVVAKLKRGKRYNTTIKGYRKYVRAQYEETQKFLKAKGVDHVDLVRGAGVRSRAKGPGGALFDGTRRDGTINTQPLSSYSTNPEKAYKFASNKSLSIMSRQRVPRERIFGTYATGIGTDYETEFVALGGKDDFTEHVTWAMGHGYMGSDSVLKKLMGDK